ncbi:MAG: Na+/H+ antiporter NhaC [Flavobacteriales bacterium]|nr:Na+/H+ antiporter NhaC [Flavobacteriales bacterium]
MAKSAPKLWQALLPLVVLIALLVANLLVFGDGSLGGPNQFALLAGAAVALVVGIVNGHRFPDLVDHMTRSIATAVPALLILLLIGSLAGSWLLSGTVPAMIAHGVQLLSPKVFLVAACVVCAIVSLATGSSWSTAATVGIALIGVGRALDLHEGLVAGAVISGAYFGDKLSPLSDTTNLAPAVAGGELFTHIRYLLNTTLPSMAIALLLFGGIGLFGEAGAASTAQLDEVVAAIRGHVRIGWWCYLPPVAVIVLIARRMPALPALFIGALMGLVVALLFQQDLLSALADGPGLKGRYRVLMEALVTRTEVPTGMPLVDELLSAKGMAGMLETVWLIVCAMTFGGAMEGAGLLQRITREVMRLVKGDGSLIATTAASCAFVNVTASDQYLAIVVPGRMYAPVFRERGLAPKVLSRTLEDAGTVTSPLVPWNTCGAYQAGVLGVATMTYLPFCFFNLASPLMTMLQGWLGWRIARTPVQPPAAKHVRGGDELP